MFFFANTQASERKGKCRSVHGREKEMEATTHLICPPAEDDYSSDMPDKIRKCNSLYESSLDSDFSPRVHFLKMSPHLHFVKMLPDILSGGHRQLGCDACHDACHLKPPNIPNGTHALQPVLRPRTPPPHYAMEPPRSAHSFSSTSSDNNKRSRASECTCAECNSHGSMNKGCCEVCGYSSSRTCPECSSHGSINKGCCEVCGYASTRMCPECSSHGSINKGRCEVCGYACSTRKISLGNESEMTQLASLHNWAKQIDEMQHLLPHHRRIMLEQVAQQAAIPLKARPAEEFQPQQWVPYQHVKDKNELTFALSELKIRSPNGRTKEVILPLLVHPNTCLVENPHNDPLIGKWL